MHHPRGRNGNWFFFLTGGRFPCILKVDHFSQSFWWDGDMGEVINDIDSVLRRGGGYFVRSYTVIQLLH